MSEEMEDRRHGGYDISCGGMDMAKTVVWYLFLTRRTRQLSHMIVVGIANTLAH